MKKIILIPSYEPDDKLIELVNNLKEKKLEIVVVDDGSGKEYNDIFNKINAYKDLYQWADIVPVSALKGNNTLELIKVIKKYLPDEVKYFEDGQVTNRSREFMIAELIREKVLRLTEEEVPHSVTVATEKIVKDKNSKK